MGGTLLVARADGNFSLLQTYFKSEELTSFCEARCLTQYEQQGQHHQRTKAP